MKHGVVKCCFNRVLTLLTSQSVTVNLVQPGRILSKSHPFLGASLDSIVTNVRNLETWALEVKCPSSKLDQSINDVLKDRKFYLEKANGKIQSKRLHKYFHQIQGQMFCTQLKRVDFVVYFGKNVPLYVETVMFDENFWQQILPRIEFFFRRAVVPELLTRRVQRGQKLYQHGGWNNK